MNTLHPEFRTALQPFAPAQSDVHFTEAERVEADRAVQKWKDGHNARSEANALRLQIQQQSSPLFLTSGIWS